MYKSCTLSYYVSTACISLISKSDNLGNNIGLAL